VTTTRKPSKQKSIDAAQVRNDLRAGKSILLVFGLGPRGLPKEVFEMTEKHLDITGRGLSLETCTALGAVVGSLLGK
jgi:hypothetical protein